MLFKNRKAQAGKEGMKLVKKLYANGEPTGEEFYAKLEPADGAAGADVGTPLAAENFNKGNWRDDNSVSYEKLEDDTLPQAHATKTQIVTKANGEVWVIPPTGKSAYKMEGNDNSDSVYVRGIAAGGSLNNYFNKNQVLNVSAAVANRPTTTESFYVWVMTNTNGTGCKQLAVGLSTGKLYTRGYENGMWTSWVCAGTEVTVLNNTDFNTITTSGNYRITNTTTNAPTSNATSWQLFVFGDTSGITQMASYYSNTQPTSMWLRKSIGGVTNWNAWRMVITSPNGILSADQGGLGVAGFSGWTNPEALIVTPGFSGDSYHSVPPATSGYILQSRGSGQRPAFVNPATIASFNPFAAANVSGNYSYDIANSKLTFTPVSSSSTVLLAFRLFHNQNISLAVECSTMIKTVGPDIQIPVIVRNFSTTTSYPGMMTLNIADGHAVMYVNVDGTGYQLLNTAFPSSAWSMFAWSYKVIA